MLNSRRSASVGALPHEKRHFVSRVESASGAALDVRCACQYFQSDSLLPERVNPVDSRPGSKLGYHSELGELEQQFHPMNMQRDDLSTHSFEVISHGEVEPPPVDLSFVERYPELEQTARSRGLVVRSISDAKESDLQSGSQASFMAGHRRRQLSVGGMSTGSATRYQRREPETMSMRSGNSLRRISAGNSKMDLYCADINIPGPQSRQRSVSASRRTSNADLFQASILAGPLQPPQLNLIAPTPNADFADVRPEFPPHQASPVPDFRNAKPPLSADYMRPSDVNTHLDTVLPQHRPIDVSRFGGDAVRPSFLVETDYKALQNPYQPTVTPIDPLAKTVSELEDLAAMHNIVDIRDNIQTETYRPPSLADELSAKSLHLDEQTKITINNDLPVVDIDALVRCEAVKAEAEQEARRSRSPRPKSRRANSPPVVMATLQLPSSRTASSTTQTSVEQSIPAVAQHPAQQPLQSQQQLKRQHTPERQLSPERPNKLAPTAWDTQAANLAGPIPLQHASPEVKTSYASRFKSMFSTASSRQKFPSPQPVRKASLSPKRERSPSLWQQKEKSPSPSKLMSVFSKNKPVPMAIVSNQATVMKKQDAEPMSVRVTETFSLKVDDMDQYSARPHKAATPPTHSPTIYSSREDFAAAERDSVGISEAFSPVVVSAVPRGIRGSIGSSTAGFVAGNRNLYSSEIEMPHWARSDTEYRSSTSKDASIVSHGSRPLISVPIQIGGSAAPPVHAAISGFRELPPSLGRAPSVQRFGVQRKSSFREPRTQSDDRKRLTGSQEHLYGSSARMTKTVSFNFDERKSRLAEFESNSPLTQKQNEHRDFLERTYFSRDHDYEPIGVTPSAARESSPAVAPIFVSASAHNGSAMDMDIDVPVDERYLSSTGTTPRTESRTDYEIHTSQVDSSALEELPLQPESRKKGFMATAQDRTRKMQDGLRNQAGKIRTKLRPQPKKPVSGSPKAKERRRFKAPEFAKIKMPEIKRPDMSKFKEMKRPEFTKFNKPDMSKFKLPEKLSTLKLRRSKSFKENEPAAESELPEESPESPITAAAPAPAPKKKFEFNFGTYPRAFRKKKPVEPVVAVESSLGTEGLSVIPSTETQPSSTSSPQGDRGPGPVRSRWADKFSDVSYNDSEGSRYRRYGSELESFDRESSLERRMKEDLEDTGSEAQPQVEQHDMGILSGVADSKQFAEFNEENRAIHEISKLRSREFQRRPLMHQDSDLRSEDSHETEGWTEKDIQKNKLLRKAEIEAESSYFKYLTDETMAQDAQSTASSGKKLVMEEINDDEFFMRKRGVSEDNIQLRQYISAAIREGYDMPNALANVGHSREQPIEYGDYDVPPPKPRRLHKNYRPDYSDSQEFQRSEYGDDLSMSQNGSDFLPKRPLRKARSRSKYSMDSQDLPMADEGSSVQYFDDDEEYLRPPMREQAPADSEEAFNNFNLNAKAVSAAEPSRPLAPRRHKKRARDEVSVEKDADAYFNGFGGRSVSNSFLQPQEDVIVYRTEHQYHIPLATPENFTDGASARTRVSEDERTSRGVDSLVLEQQSVDLPVPPQQDDEKFVIDMLENDGYAVVRKELLPKPTPPARRKKFARSVGERFATLPTRGSPPPARPPPPLQYTPSDSPMLPPRRRSTASLENMAAGMDVAVDMGVGRGMGMSLGAGVPTTSILVKSNNEEDDYEEPEALERPESPRSNLQSGEVINKMKYRPLPPPPRPPRGERRQRGADSKGERTDDEQDSERIATSSTADSYDQHEFEVEVSTQTDPLPDDFVCEEFEITEDMKIIEPRRSTGSRTLEDLLRGTQQSADEVDGARPLTEDEQLARGLQRFRDANQRSMSERSRNSSQADRSKSLSRPQTPSAIVIERRVPTPSPTSGEDDTLQASLIVRPISAADLADEELRREEEELRREGLLSDSSVQSKSDVETAGEEEEAQVALSDYAASSADLDAAVEQLQQAQLESDYESKLEDDEVERTLRDSEYDEEQEDEADTEEKYSDHYDEEDDWRKEELQPEEVEEEHQLTEQELEALEKQLQEEMKEELAVYRAQESHAQLEAGSVEASEEQAEAESEHEPVVEQVFIVAKGSEAATAAVPKFVASLPIEPAADSVEEEEFEPVQIPLPPPRRKSTTLLEPVAAAHTLTIAEHSSRELTPVTAVQPQSATDTQHLPSRLAELEVERLRVHALQAGQIMVSQLHGEQISADELECKSGNLVVKNIELPPGFIEDIVERVRNSEQRAPLLTTETQTSRQPSSEIEAEPPLKPPRQSKAAEAAAMPLSNLDEQTQTEAGMLPLPPPPAVYPSVEYLQSLAPLAFYNLQRSGEAEHDGDATGTSTSDRKAPHKCRRRHAQQRRSEQEEDELLASGSDLDEPLVERSRSRSHRSRTRSATQPPDEDEPKTVMQAGKQFITACSLELINIINQLTNYVRGDVADPQQQQQSRNLSALMVLFILITFGLLVYLLTGRQVHTHHWDYFNPPSNEGRQT